MPGSLTWHSLPRASLRKLPIIFSSHITIWVTEYRVERAAVVTHISLICRYRHSAVSAELFSSRFFAHTSCPGVVDSCPLADTRRRAITWGRWLASSLLVFCGRRIVRGVRLLCLCLLRGELTSYFSLHRFPRLPCATIKIPLIIACLSPLKSLE